MAIERAISRTAAGRVRAGLARLILGLALGAGLGVAVFAQSFTFSNVVIEGNQRIEAGTILTFAGISRGETVSAAELNDAGQRIRASGLFESVEIIPQGGTLLIRVVEYPTINRISFEGNRRLSDSELEAVVRSEPRRVYTPAQAERDVAAITEAYATAGRINATVTPRIIRRADNRVDLVFEIFEGGLTEVERISFVGNRAFGDRRLRGILETKQAGLLRAVVARDTFVEDRIAFDRQVLTDFYRSRGYVDFEVLSVDVQLTRERDAFLITFNVREGQQFRVGNVTVTSEVAGADPEIFERALRADPGDIFSPVLIETDIARLETLALDRGLRFVRVEPRITRNDRDLTLDVEYALVPGERIFIERIDIEGNTTTLDRVIRSRFDAVEGDPFNPRQIRESADRIRALGYFADVDVRTREGSSPDQLVVDVDVVEQPTGSLSFGANYSTDTGVSLLVNFRERNFLGRGQQLDFGLSTGETNRFFDFNFVEPRFLARDLRFGLSASYSTTDNQNALYDTEKGLIRPSFAFPVSDYGRLSVFYQFEFTDISDVDPSVSPIIQAEAAQGGLGVNSVGYSYSFDPRRDGLDPTSGVLLRFGQEFGVGEDVEFIRTTALASAETRVFQEEVTLRATIEGGALTYNEGTSRVTDRFFLGSRIMRGFEPGGIGPRDANTDDALGGNLYAVARLEAEFPLGLPEEYGISGGVFIDYGSVWEVGVDSPDILYDDFTPRTVAGFSIFWNTPIGPLRFNFTEPLDVQEFDETRSFDVTISTQF